MPATDPFFQAGLRAARQHTRAFERILKGHQESPRVNTLPTSILPALVLPSLIQMFGGCVDVGRKQPIGRGRIVGWDAGGVRRLPRRGRNQLCRCDSGRKFKHCCGGPG